MKPEINEVLQEVKANLANSKPQVNINTLRYPQPDFKTMSIMESTKWCIENGITKAPDIARLTGKKVNTIHTAMWKLRNPKRVKVLQRRAKKAKALKAGVTVAKVAKVSKMAKPKITNGLYDDGMETPYIDAIQRQGGSFDLFGSFDIDKIIQKHEAQHELVAENRRLKILIEHYESLLFKGGK